MPHCMPQHAEALPKLHHIDVHIILAICHKATFCCILPRGTVCTHLYETEFYKTVRNEFKNEYPEHVEIADSSIQWLKKKFE